MKIQLDKAAKRYNRDWIFRNLTYTFQQGRSYAITGPNGSGKSTLLQVLSASVSVNEGICNYYRGENILPSEKIFRHLVVCAPYMELVEEFTLIEFLKFHQSFKPFIKGVTTDSVISEIQLVGAKQKKISEFSSGMKQRIKLGQCIFSDVPVILLDEPCTNLDDAGIALFHQLINKYCSERLVIVSSNDKAEYDFCKEVINITDYK